MGRNAVEGERKLKYQEPLEGSKNPWRGKIRGKKKAVVDEQGVKMAAERKCSRILVDKPPNHTELPRYYLYLTGF